MKRFYRLWLSGLGLGYLPIAPATWGSLWGLGLAYSLSSLPWAWRIALITIGWLFSAWAIVQLLGRIPTDPPWIVADEYWALAAIALFMPIREPEIAALAFFFFRFWDICKVFPADWVEDLPTPWGILLDDVVAMFYTTLCLWLIV